MLNTAQKKAIGKAHGFFAFFHDAYVCCQRGQRAASVRSNADSNAN